MDRPLRLITASPVDRLAMTLEALLVVASQPLSVDDLAAAADDDPARVERRLAPQEPEALVVALRALAEEPPAVSLAHLELRFPPVAQFLQRFRAVLSRRRVFDLDAEVEGMSRIEQAVAFLALLELRRGGEVALEQAAPFAPIRVRRSAPASEERRPEWTARSA